MIVELLEAHGLAVVDKVQLGPTKIVRTAILAGQIDIYPEYTGNGAFFFNREADPAWKNGPAGYALVKQLDAQQNHLDWLAPAPANNTWAIALRRDLAEKAKLATMSEFAKYVSGGGTVKLAASAEFVNSPAALPAFQTAYGFALTQDQLLVLSGGDTAVTIKAAAEGTSGVNAAMCYGTDGQLAALGLSVMQDDKGVQPVYEPAPVIRDAVLQSHPEIPGILDPVFASLTLERLQALNARIAVKGEQAKAVAADYLKTQGFLK
jgi:osmoprotectant transport system substrate-binding protein